MPTKQFTVGQPDAPNPGSTIFQHEFLRSCLVNFIIVDNVPENQLKPNPDFRHSYVEGEIDRSPNIWVIGNKLIIDYSPCENCK
jgi:hypothetical protein